MKYFIRSVLPKVGKYQEIYETEYKKITQARKLAWDILLVKEHFSYVVRNFTLLENELNKIETKANKDLQDDLDKFWEKSSNGDFSRENIHILNLLVINLLTTCRTYLELFDYQGQNEQREAFSGKNEIRQSLKQIKETYHRQDDILCIFFWTLRNYAQHHARPITGSPSNINDREVKINLIINAAKVFSTLTEKRLKNLKISDPTGCLKSYVEDKLPYLDLSKYPRSLTLRILIQKYIVLLKKVNDEFSKELEPKLQEAKNIITCKVEYYCHDSSAESAFEIYKQNLENESVERLDVSLSLFNSWESVIEKYS